MIFRTEFEYQGNSFWLDQEAGVKVSSSGELLARYWGYGYDEKEYRWANCFGQVDHRE